MHSKLNQISKSKNKTNKKFFLYDNKQVADSLVENEYAQEIFEEDDKLIVSVQATKSYDDQTIDLTGVVRYLPKKSQKMLNRNPF